VNAIADDDKNTRSAESLEAMAAELNTTLKDEAGRLLLRRVLSRPAHSNPHNPCGDSSQICKIGVNSSVAAGRDLYVFR
jgi:hypothetical protein